MLALIAATASAQIVNTQPLLGPTAAEGLHAEGRVGISWLTGNVPLLNARGNLLLRYRTGRHTVLSSSSTEFGRGGGDPFLNRQITHLRYQYRLGERFTAEAYGQLTYDQVWRLQLRALTGANGRVYLLETDKLRVITGLGAFFEHERLDREPGTADAGLKRNNVRLNHYATVQLQLDPQIKLLQTAFVQPKVDAWSDHRILSISSIVFKIKEKLAITASLQLAYSSWTPETIVPLDTNAAWELTWSN